MQEEYPALSLQVLEELIEINATQQQYQKYNEKAQMAADRNTKAYVPLRDDDLTVKASNILNIVLLGKTGAGKSSTGNLLLGENKFVTSAANKSCTSTIQAEECWIDDVKLRVVDTPGFFDTSVTQEAIATELLKVKQFPYIV